MSDASTIIQEAADEDANIIFGAVVDPALKGKVKITVIATGFAPQVAVTIDVRGGPYTGRHVDVLGSRPPAGRACAADLG